jgi:hypothetical protein
MRGVRSVKEERETLRFIASAPLSEPSSIFTEASLAAGTEPALEVLVPTFNRDDAGIWTLGDGAAGDSATILSRSSADKTEALSAFRFAFLDDFAEETAFRGTGVAFSASLEARRADKMFSAPMRELTSCSDSPSSAATSSSHNLTFSRVKLISSSSSSSDVSSSRAAMYRLVMKHGGLWVRIVEAISN